jgi:uncharacterized protein YjbI with pentapeptide repeats
MNNLSALLELGRGADSSETLRFHSVVVGLDGFTESCENSNFSKKSLVNVVFEKSQFSWSLRDSEFDKVDFIHCHFDRAWMTRTKWRDCRFDESTITPEVTDAVFERCSFRNLRFKGVRQEYGGRRARFVNCDFTGSKFLSAKLLACRFIDCVMDQCEFIKCDLRGTIINGEKK